MTASLYQSATSGASSDAGGRTSPACLSSDNTEDMRGQGVRIELDEVAPPGPGVAAAAEEVVHLVGLPGAQAELLDREIDPGRVAGGAAEGDPRPPLVVGARLCAADGAV